MKLKTKGLVSKANSPTKITVPRVMRVHPEVVCGVCKKVKVDDFGTSLAPCYRNSVAGYIIPDDDVETYDKWVQWSLEFSKRISANKASRADQEKYYNLKRSNKADLMRVKRLYGLNKLGEIVRVPEVAEQQAA